MRLGLTFKTFGTNSNFLAVNNFPLQINQLPFGAGAVIFSSQFIDNIGFVITATTNFTDSGHDKIQNLNKKD